MQIEIFADIVWPPHTFIRIYYPDGSELTYGFGPLHEGRPIDAGHIYNDAGHPFNNSSGRIDISDQQYAALAAYINQSIPNPPDYNPFVGSECTTWVMNGLREAGIMPGCLAPDLGLFFNTLVYNPYLQYVGFDIANSLRNLLSSASQVISPLALDLDKDGVETTALNSGAYFDHDKNGFAEQTGWVSSDDGLLVLDKNGDGIINDGGELFGNETVLQNGQDASNGFQALAQLDGNLDGKIDANDGAYSQLRVWQDVDGDGYSSEDELFTLTDLGIQSINTGFTSSSFVDANGNEHRQIGAFTWSDGTTSTATDVWFQTDKTYTIANEWLDVPDDIAALPGLPGYGNVYDLHQAMVRDTTGQLKTLVEQFIASTNESERQNLMDQILYKWTGSDGVDPGSSGSYIDGRKVAVLEALLGETYAGNWGPGIAGPNAASLLSQAYDLLHESFYAQLMVQTHLKSFYDLITYSWDETTEALTGDLTAVGNELNARIAANYDAGAQDLAEFVQSLRDLQAVDMMNFIEFRTQVGSDPYLYSIISEGGKLLIGTTGNDSLIGSSGTDDLRGNAGDDYLYGGSGGNDLFNGGAGNDILVGATGNDTYVFGRGSGNDALFDSGGTDVITLGEGITPASIEFGLSSIQYDNGIYMRITDTGETLRLQNWFASDSYKIETIRFADGTELTAAQVTALATAGGLAATEGSDEIWVPDDLAATVDGKGGNDTLHGGSKDDILIGGTGDDTLIGGMGNDTYIVDSTGDVITENTGEGTDTVSSSVSYTLGSNLENLIVTGTSAVNGTGNELNNSIIGNSENNILTGLAGDDTIDGGAGADTMIGGMGNDTYIVDSTGDVIIENAGEGTDTVVTPFDTSLAGSNLENLTLTGTSAVNATGNEFDNLLTGNGIANVLTGLAGDDTIDGGAGADTMIGGMGNDTYIVDSTGDVIIENAGEGTDTVVSYITYTLNSANLENLTLAGNSSINAVGNSLDNRLTGNSGNNTLDGGAGADTMIGGMGNDTYIVDSTGDVIIENAGEGTDTVSSSVSYTLASNIENLTLTGSAISGTGNELNNVITGNSSDNLLAGHDGNDILNAGLGNDLLDGGTGSDYLQGGAGDDTFIWGTGVGSDTINEGNGGGTDTIQFGALNSTDFDFYLTPWQGYDGIYLKNKTTGERLYLQNWFTGDGYKVENFQFSDTTLTAAQIQTIAATNGVLGTDSADILSAPSSFGSTMYGKGGNDYLYGAGLNDTLYGGAGNDYLYGYAGNDLLYGDDGSDTLYGNEGNDLLDGGAGNDYLYGGTGDDTYLWSTGSGNDTINEQNTGGTDTISFGSLASTDVEISLTPSSSTNGILVTIINTGETLTLSNWFASDQYKVENFQFSDTTLTASEVQALAAAAGVVGTDNADILSAPSSFGSTMYGKGGNDYLYGAGLNDTLYGGAGNDTVYGGNANDLLYGDAGSDTLYGDAGNDLLDGGAGNDYLYGGAGDDTYIFGLNSGNDTVNDSGADVSTQDTILFNDEVIKDTIALYQSGQNLVIGYGSTETINVTSQFQSDYGVEKLELTNGLYLTTADINQVIQDINAFATSHGISLTNINDVKNNQELMTIISNSWHS